MFFNRISKYPENMISSHNRRLPGISHKQPADRSQKSAARRQQQAAGKSWLFILLGLLSLLWWFSGAAAEVTEKELPDAFTDVIHKLSALGDRSTGTPGNEEAAL